MRAYPMHSAPVTLTTLVLLLAVASACRGAPAETGRSSVPDTASAVVVPDAPDEVADPQDSARGDGCIRGGTPRAEVRRIMGEPDSVSFGSWLYGSSEIMFGYGVVVDFRNDGVNLVLC